MNKRIFIKKLAVLILIVTVLMNSSAASSDDMMNEILSKADDLKEFIGLNDYIPPDAINVSVHGYAELAECLENFSSNWEDKFYIINLEDGDYNITNPIEWGKMDTHKKFILNGNNKTIDGRHKHEFMNLYNDLKVSNLNVVNTHSSTGNESSVISMKSPRRLKIENCSFSNNVGDKKGCVITNRGKTSINNSVFTNNTVKEVGGSIWSTGEHGGTLVLTNNTFKDNVANKDLNHERTAIVYMVSGGDNVINNNSFVNNNGRCIHSFNKTNTKIVDNRFINNTINDSEVIRGGVIDNYESDITVANNVFDGDKSMGELRGGIIYHEIGYMNFSNNVVNNYHIKEDPSNNTNCSKGGVVFNRNASVDITSNAFNNTLQANMSRGGVIYNNLGNITLKDNNFTNHVVDMNVSGLCVYNDVNSIINASGNVFNSILNGKSFSSDEKEKYIFNSRQQNNESNGTQAVTYYS